MSRPENQSADISHSTSIAYEASEQSGTLTHHNEPALAIEEDPSTNSASHNGEAHRSEGEEQPLEWHEVIELQAFSDRKAWIEEKIRLLEQMPPIDVFVGSDIVRDLALQVPGLPTRMELQDWISEHDRIEKETEVFDSGELKKLKKFTKAAAQRNLSAADTDLIEITLTTIYALDKLLHLLRDRSDHLDLLGVRLTWEERRIAAWTELHNTIDDITGFLRTRARWSPNVYDDLEVLGKDDEPTPPLSSSHRRNSVVSIASMASDTSNASLSYSRGARFKLSEQLSRDAAQFASRVSSLRHTKINAAGKALDKLIDDSRKPVPEVLLDEQDRLEDKGIKEMEDVGKFVMSVVMQWKKADEVYVETVKDKGTALELVEEIETAKLCHPNSRQDAAYLSRTNALTKRLAIRGNPAGSSSTFPRPCHALFPDQPDTTDYIIQLLSSEYITAVEHAKKAEALSRQYHAGLDAVKRVEAMCKAAAELADQLAACIYKFRDGVDDDTPPDLTTEACLLPSRHAVFLAFLPTLTQESQRLETAVGCLSDAFNVAFADLDRPGIDSNFIVESKAEIDRLRSTSRELTQVRVAVASRVTNLHTVRHLWTHMKTTFEDIIQIRYDMIQSVEHDMWRQKSGLHNAPPTPDGSPASLPLAFPSATDFPARLGAVALRLEQEYPSLPDIQIEGLGPALRAYVVQCRNGLSTLVANSQHFFVVLEAIRRQAFVMRSIELDVNDLHAHLENLELKFEGSMQEVLEGSLYGEELSSLEQDLLANMERLKLRIQMFSDSLINRIPFVSDGGAPTSDLRASLVRPMRLAFSLESVVEEASARLPLDLIGIDHGVRVDANTFSVGLSGCLESLTHKAEAFHLSQVSRTLDVAVATVVNSLQQIEAALISIMSAVDSDDSSPPTLGVLDELSRRTEDLSGAQLPSLVLSFNSMHDLLDVINSGPTTLHSSLFDPRRRTVHSIEQRYASCKVNVDLVAKRVANTRCAEEARLRELQRLEDETRIAAEQCRRDDEVRKAVEERQQRQQEAFVAAELHKAGLDACAAEEQLKRGQRVHTTMEQLKPEQEPLATVEQCRPAEVVNIQRQTEEVERVVEQIQKEKQAEVPLALESDQGAESKVMTVLQVDEDELPSQTMSLKSQYRPLPPVETALVQATLTGTGAFLPVVEEETAEKSNHEQDSLCTAVGPVESGSDRIHSDTSVISASISTEDDGCPVQFDDSEDGIADTQTLGLASMSASKAKRSQEISATVVLQSAWEPSSSQDIFSIRSGMGVSPDGWGEIKNVIFKLRKRLRSIGINQLARPTSRGLHSLPTEAQCSHVKNELMLVAQQTEGIVLTSLEDKVADVELRSLRSEIEASQELLHRVHLLTELAKYIATCDNALSDLLEHIDSYPSLPLGPLSASHVSDPSQTADEQLTVRLTFTEELITTLKAHYSHISDDVRARSEYSRILQTWSELQAMGMDRIQKSRPGSVLSSQASGSSRPASVVSVQKTHRKAAGYANLSVGSPSQFLSPPLPHTRRAASGGAPRHPRGGATHARSSSRASLSSNRSISGPGPVDTPSRDTPSRLYNSTFASRQRTSSISTITSAITSAKVDRATPITSRVRAQTAQSQVSRTASPAFSDASSMYSRSSMNQSRASMRSNWARAPRQSFPNLPRSPPRPAIIRKPYVANPKNKLDVAVGDVVNKLPSNVDINVEVVADTWKDQSGKYWIGNQDAKLCFCRILRSQTVMVRVGGGWSELSKFIKDHFADAFRLLPESPPRFGTREEQWIDSTTLSQAAGQVSEPPRTPEPTNPFVPSFALSTPSGASPRSIKTSSPGSPLTALQFIRRADRESPLLRPDTPTKSTNRSVAHAPVLVPRVPAWRP